MGVTYPYLQIPQRDNDLWRHEAAEYVKRVDPARAAERVKELQAQVADAEKNAKDRVAALKADLEYAEKVEKFAKDQKASDKPKVAKDLYSQQAYRSMAVCLQCHNIGSQTIEGPQGPNLALSAERLRPEWTEQWIANPRRLFSYEPIMPQNFPNKANRLEWFDEARPFIGTPLEQTRAVRNVLMDSARLSDLNANMPPLTPPKKDGDKK